MSETPNLALPLLAAAQAQKHVTHNEALFAIDALLQVAVRDRDLAVPPGSPAEGERYIVAAGATGAWAGRAGSIASRQDGIWRFHAPRAGFVAYVADERLLYFHDGTAWAPLSAGLLALNAVGLLGIGTLADAANPFSARLNGALWTARTVAEVGTGDLRCVMNRETAARTVSLLLQTGYSGRAEIGLVGNDRLSLRTSPDGATWTTPLAIDTASGAVDLAAVPTAVASAATCDIGAAPGLRVTITGSVGIGSFGSRPNALRLVTFAGGLVLSHHAGSLALPGAADILTAAGDSALAVSDGAGAWRVVAYQRADGTPLAPPAASVRTDAAQALTAGQQLQGRRNLGMRGAGTAQKSAAHTVVPADAGRLFACTGTWTLALPAAAVLGDGFALELVNEGSGQITIDPNGAETVNGAATWPLLGGESCLLVCDGGAWRACLQAANQGIWAAYTPVLGAQTGAIGASGPCIGQFRRSGRSIELSVDCTILTNASAAGYATISLPHPAPTGRYQIVSGRECATTGKSLTAVLNAHSPTLMAVFNYDLTYPGGSGARFALSGTYEAA